MRRSLYSEFSENRRRVTTKIGLRLQKSEKLRAASKFAIFALRRNKVGDLLRFPRGFLMRGHHLLMSITGLCPSRHCAESP